MIQTLADAIDLIVKTTTRKRKELRFEFGKPRSLLGKKHLPCLKLGRRDRHARLLGALRLNRSDAADLVAQLSDQSEPSACVFYENLIRPPLVCELFNLTF